MTLIISALESESVLRAPGGCKHYIKPISVSAVIVICLQLIIYRKT